LSNAPEQRPSAERDPSSKAGDGGVGIVARNLTRRFGAHTALDRLSLEVAPRETYGLLGANGAGKTTFIRMVTGYLLPSEGDLSVGGISPASNPHAVNRRLGFVMETSRLYPELRVVGLLRFLAGARGLKGGPASAAIDRVIDRFHLGGVARRLVGNLSKGYQQRVSLAQAFLHDPPLVIVDEPTGGLDPVQRGEVQEILNALQGERTVVLCTHDLEEARALTNRLAVLNAGKLVAEGETQQVLGGDDPLSMFQSETATGRTGDHP
jgi:ABC-2 type transport system ATP-binding protein